VNNKTSHRAENSDLENHQIFHIVANSQKWKNKYIFVFIKREKRNSRHCQNIFQAKMAHLEPPRETEPYTYVQYDHDY